MIMLVAMPLTMGISTVDAAPKANSQKVVAKSETYPTLRKGSRSSYVKNLQQSLTDVKYHTSVDGTFGSKTQTMVKQFPNLIIIYLQNGIVPCPFILGRVRPK